MNRPCPTRVLCDTEYPFANLSSETPDQLTYFALGYCCDGTIQDATSTVSQQLADEALERNLVQNCTDCNDPYKFCATASCPDGSLLTEVCVQTSQTDANNIAAIRQGEMQGDCGDKSVLFSATCACPNGNDSHTVYSNVSQALANSECAAIPKVNCASSYSAQAGCSVYCPDGTIFTFFIPAGTLVGFTQSEADAMAQSYACLLARSHRICLSGLSTNWCQGTAFSENIRATGIFLSGTANTWYLSGSVPPGLALAYATTGVNNTLTGIPTTDGSYTFSVTVIAPNGDYMTKSYTMCITNISPATIPDATQTVDYSQTFSASVCLSGTLSWTITDGTIPDGLSLDSATGVFSGNPASTGSYNFTVTVSNGTNSCSKEYTMTVNSSTRSYAYYKLDSKNTIVPFGDVCPEIIDFNWDMNNTNATATLISGKISNGWTHSGSAGFSGPLGPFDFTGKNFLIRFWARVIGNVGSWGFNIWNILADNAGGTSYNLQVYPFFRQFYPRFYAVNAGEFLDSTIALDSTWRRVVFGHKIADNSIFIRIDQNPIESLILSSPFGAGASRFDMGGVNGKAEIDELGFWWDAAALWNEAAYIADWNGGAGKTYP